MQRQKALDPNEGMTAESFKQEVIDNLYYSQGTTPQSGSTRDLYFALARTVRDRLVDRWRATTAAHYQANPKFVYYLSAEYLLGRQLTQNVLYTDAEQILREVVNAAGRSLDEVLELDVEPGLGNGGLGRLAACFLDSLATLDIPALGYGIRYEYGIFRQSFRDGWQVEHPDDWLFYGNPWEFAQPDDMVEVMFGGHTEPFTDDQGRYGVRWAPGQRVLGEPYHLFVPGYGTTTVNMLRLWRARATQEFDFQLFDVGDYARAVEEKVYSENISKVLYPNDNTLQGKRLRLSQEYFFVACSLRDIIRRFRLRNRDWAQFPEKVVIQLNDTHPVVAIPELMRILVDEEMLQWDEAWSITRRTFAYTCHTLMPEALERWPVSLFGELLPRHLEIVLEINRRFLDEVRHSFPGDEARLSRMSIIEEGAERQVRMAHLAAVGCFAVNGVAKLQSDLLRERTLGDFGALWPEKFQNKTNGVTPRRFMRLANPRLAELITAKIGDGWLRDLEQLRGIEAYVDAPGFRADWQGVKAANKRDLADYIRKQHGVEVDPTSLFDVMAKRLHEYKRQLLQALHIITLYQRMKADPAYRPAPRTFIFGAKAAPGYQMAKLIIKLINSIAAVVNADPAVGGVLRVVFLENFNVTLAEKIYPAADLSEQISLAGKEASGTGNMKFALNGAVTIGTLDGANIEIRDLVGPENFFLFGLTADEVFRLRERGYNPRDYYVAHPELRAAVDAIGSGGFSPENPGLFQPIVASLLTTDPFMVLADYPAFMKSQEQVERTFGDRERWTEMSILNAARCGFFSSDRTIRQYCAEVWQVHPVPATGLA